MVEFFADKYKFKMCYFENIGDPQTINDYIKANQPPVALIDARTIISLAHVQVAILNMRTIQERDQTQSKSIYLEILRCLSPDGRLNGALKFCAIQKDTTAVIAITFEDEFPSIPGLSDPKTFDQFLANPKTDFDKIKKAFKLSDAMLATYSHEQLVITTLSVLASGLHRVKQM